MQAIACVGAATQQLRLVLLELDRCSRLDSGLVITLTCEPSVTQATSPRVEITVGDPRDNLIFVNL